MFRVIHHNTNISNKRSVGLVFALVASTMLSGQALTSSSAYAASTDSESQPVSLSVNDACTISGTIASGEDHTASILPGTYRDNIGKTTLKIVCNDTNGYAVYAVGHSGGDAEAEGTLGNTNLIGITTGLTIPTGIASENAEGSVWSMRLTKVTDSTSYLPSNLTILDSFDSNHAVPSTTTKVASYTSSTDAAKGSLIETTYATKVSNAQAADTYIGKVRYTVVHPSSASAPSELTGSSTNEDTSPTTPSESNESSEPSSTDN
ncbi:hypothetical protein IJG29_04575 [Candidatus Saccharibacteria bacterium]|nr:hypothetical protein [Candidatus Saccharibacteria bacterium]